MIQQLDLKTGCTKMIKVTFIRNTGFLDVTIKSTEPLIFSKDKILGVVYLRSI